MTWVETSSLPIAKKFDLRELLGVLSAQDSSRPVYKGTFYKLTVTPFGTEDCSGGLNIKDGSA